MPEPQTGLQPEPAQGRPAGGEPLPGDALRRRSIRSAFERAADSYDTAAQVQREICARLARFGHPFAAATIPTLSREQPVRALDAGCGTGFGLAQLDALCPPAQQFALDLAPAMLARARARARHPASAPAGPLPVCADLEHLPLRTASLALYWSSLAVQWCAPARVLDEASRVLAPGGLALVATLGPRTLWELRTAFAAIDNSRHTIDFHPIEHWSAAARAAGLAVLGSECVELAAWAPDLRGLLRDIKSIGAATVDGGRRRGALGRQAWENLQARYETHRRSDGQLPATYDVILLALRKPFPGSPT